MQRPECSQWETPERGGWRTGLWRRWSRNVSEALNIRADPLLKAQLVLGFRRVQARWAQRRLLCNVESHWQQCENPLRTAEWRPGVHCTDSWMGHWRWLFQLSVPEDCDAMSGWATAPGASESFVSSSSFWKFRNQKLKQSPTCTKSIVLLVTLTYTVSCDLTASLVLSIHIALLWLLFLFALFLLCL